MIEITPEKLDFICKALQTNEPVKNDLHYKSKDEIREMINSVGFAEWAALRATEAQGHDVELKRVIERGTGEIKPYARIHHYEAIGETFNQVMAEILAEIGEKEFGWYELKQEASK